MSYSIGGSKFEIKIPKKDCKIRLRNEVKTRKLMVCLPFLFLKNKV